MQHRGVLSLLLLPLKSSPMAERVMTRGAVCQRPTPSRRTPGLLVGNCGNRRLRFGDYAEPDLIPVGHSCVYSSAVKRVC